MKRISFVSQANDRVIARLMIVLGIVLAFLNILLVQQNKKLKVLASRPDRVLEVKPGTALPPLEGLDSNGVGQSIDYGRDSRKTILFILTPGCQACEANMPNWKSIVKGIDRRSYRIAAVSLQSEGFNGYLSRHGMADIPSLTKINPKSMVAYNLALTPQTILIDPSGRVEKVWTGILRGKDKQDVELALNIRLP